MFQWLLGYQGCYTFDVLFGCYCDLFVLQMYTLVTKLLENIPDTNLKGGLNGAMFGACSHMLHLHMFNMFCHATICHLVYIHSFRLI